MGSFLKVALVTAMLLVVCGKVDAKFCGMRIRGSGRLTYPSFKKKINPPKIFRTGLDKTADCIVFGEIGWNRNLILNLTNVTPNAKISMTAFTATKSESEVRQLPVVGEQNIQIEGNVSRYFELKFPIRGTSFTLAYTRKKARSLNGGVDGKTTAVDGKVCGESLHGNGRLSYSGAPIEREFALQERNRNCTLRGKVKWTNNVILNFRGVTANHTIHIEQCGAVTPGYHSFSRDHEITLEGDRSKFFTIEFPRRGFNFTLTYTQLKSRSDFQCGPLQRWTQNIAGISCNKRCSSSCAIQCRKGESFWPPLYSFDDGAPIFDEIHAECRPNTSGTQAWAIKALTFDGELFSRRDELIGENALVTCDKRRCENPPESVEVISCTNQFYRNSHCTLQCKQGFVAFPGLKSTRSNSSYFFRDDVKIPVTQFEATCRDDLKYPNRGIWDNLTPTGSHKAESCFNITHVKYLCSRRDPNSYRCPYSYKQLNVILGTKGAISLLGPILQWQDPVDIIWATRSDCSPYCVLDENTNDLVPCGTFKTEEQITKCIPCHHSKADACESTRGFGG